MNRMTVMETLLTVRLDAKTERLLARIAEREGVSRSAVVRMALRRLADVGASPTTGSAYDAIEDLVGCFRSGHGRLSEQTGRRFRELLAAREAR